jgi:hypothetical protein
MEYVLDSHNSQIQSSIFSLFCYKQLIDIVIVQDQVKFTITYFQFLSFPV